MRGKDECRGVRAIKEARKYTRVTGEDRRRVIQMFFFSASIISCLALW